MIKKLLNLEIIKEGTELTLHEYFEQVHSKLEEIADINYLTICEAERNNRLSRIHKLKTSLLEVYRQKQHEDINETFKWIINGNGVNLDFLTTLTLVSNINNVGNQINDVFQKEFERYRK